MTAAEQSIPIDDTLYYIPPHDRSSALLDGQPKVVEALAHFRSANITAAQFVLETVMASTGSTSDQLMDNMTLLRADLAANALSAARDKERKRMVSERLAVIFERQRQ